MKIRPCNEDDVVAVRRFVEACPPLALHTEFTYWVTLRYWGSLCLIAEEGGEMHGYVSSIGVADDRDLLYVWQIGVAPGRRGSGIGRRLLEELRGRATGRGYTRFQVSVAQNNSASLRLFEQFATDLSSELQLVAAGQEPTYEGPLC